MDVSLVSENFHIYILISRHATDRHRHRPRFRAHSLSLSELLPNMLIKEEELASGIITTQTFALWPSFSKILSILFNSLENVKYSLSICICGMGRDSHFLGPKATKASDHSCRFYEGN